MEKLWPILLLFASNVFMTIAWYGHLKFKSQPLWLVVLASWGIAFFEYMLQVPANRLGDAQFTVTQLKVIQEAITLIVFAFVVVMAIFLWATDKTLEFALYDLILGWRK